jgi:hypothetical protein
VVVVAGTSPLQVSLTLAAAGTLLRLTPLRRLYPDALEAWDRDALRMAVEVRARPFAGAFETTAWGHELWALRGLLAELHAVVGQPGGVPIRREFALYEGTVRLGLVVDRRGAVTIEAALRADAADATRLTTVLDADQSYLPRWVAELDALLGAFPPALAAR